MLQFDCPNCQTRMQAAEEFAGKMTACPSCSTAVRIPAVEGAPTAITAEPAQNLPGAVTAPKPSKKPTAGESEDDDRPRRRRDGADDAGKAAAFGLGAGAIIAIVVGLIACVGLTVVALLVALLIPAVQKTREAASRSVAMNNMKQIVLACHMHHDATKFLPTPKVFPAGPNNPPTELSWRVSILPYIEQQGLWRQFDQKAAWDNPANSRFLQTRPQVYDHPTKQGQQTSDTHFQFFTGPNTLFPQPNSRVGLGFGVPDGTSNTFLVAEARDAVVWTKPADMAVTGGPLPLPPDRFLVGMADGVVRIVDRGRTTEQTLRMLIDPRDGQMIPADWDR